jgi:hypothetical protein
VHVYVLLASPVFSLLPYLHSHSLKYHSQLPTLSICQTWYIYMYIHIYRNIYIYIYKYICIYSYVYRHTHIYIYWYVNIHYLSSSYILNHEHYGIWTSHHLHLWNPCDIYHFSSVFHTNPTFCREYVKKVITWNCEFNLMYCNS